MSNNRGYWQFWRLSKIVSCYLYSLTVFNLIVSCVCMYYCILKCLIPGHEFAVVV